MAPARTPPIYTSPQDAANAFYQAFEARDIDAMMATWADDEDVVCIHPGGVRHVGYEAVRHSFEQLFTGDSKLVFRLDQVVLLDFPPPAAAELVVVPGVPEMLLVPVAALEPVPMLAPVLVPVPVVE